MPNVGDTKERFGRQYVYLNPEPSTAGASAAAVGHWRLALDDTGTPPVDGGGGGNTDLSFRAPVAADSPAIAVGNLVYIDSAACTGERRNTENALVHILSISCYIS